MCNNIRVLKIKKKKKFSNLFLFQLVDECYIRAKEKYELQNNILDRFLYVPFILFWTSYGGKNQISFYNSKNNKYI